MENVFKYAAICLLSLAVFWRCFRLKYVVDDDVWHNVINKRRGTKLEIRRIGWFVKMWLYGSGLFKNVTHDHIFSVVIHTLNACLLYRASGSMLAACLWLINPINHQTSLWLNGRRYAISLLAILIGWNFMWAAPAVALFCAWFHISAIVFPLLFIFTPMWWMSCLFIAGCLINHKDISKKISGRKSDFREGNENQEITPKKLILYVKSIGWYFRNIIVPVFPSMYNKFLIDFGFTEDAKKKAYSLNKEFWFGAVVLSGLLYLVFMKESFWAAWFLIFITPWCNLYQVTMNAADRYQTIAGCGLMVLLAEWIGYLPYELQIAVVCIIGTFYLIKYNPLFRAYLSVEKYHQYHLSVDPSLVSPRMFLCKIWIARKDAFSAFAMAKEGLRYEPNSFKLLLCLWEAFWTMGNFQRALQVMDIAEKHIPFGEEDETKKFFGEIRKKAKEMMPKQRYHHNNGKPIVKDNK